MVPSFGLHFLQKMLQLVTKASAPILIGEKIFPSSSCRNTSWVIEKLGLFGSALFCYALSLICCIWITRLHVVLLFGSLQQQITDDQSCMCFNQQVKHTPKQFPHDGNVCSERTQYSCSMMEILFCTSQLLFFWVEEKQNVRVLFSW